MKQLKRRSIVLRAAPTAPGCSGCSGCSDKGESSALVPIIRDIHKAVYTAASNPRALAMENWNLAAMKIYDASAPGYKINPCRFYDSNAEALADMKALAEQDAK